MARIEQTCAAFVLVIGCCVASAQLCTRAPAGLSDLTDNLYQCGGASPWYLLKYLWSPIKLQLKCTRGNYRVYTGSSLNELLDNYRREQSAQSLWPSLSWGRRDSRAYEQQLSPFPVTFVAVPNGGGCVMSSSAQTQWPLLAIGAAGLALFLWARPLSTSQAFRLGAGSALFTSGALVLLPLLLLFLLPNKRHIAAAGAALGSTSMTLLRWAYGTWLPPLEALLRSRLALAYMATTGLLGAAVTYYYDNPDRQQDPRLNTIIRVMLQLVGLGCIYCSTWVLPEASAAIIIALVASRVLLPLLRRATRPGGLFHSPRRRRVTFNETIDYDYPASAPPRMHGRGSRTQAAGDDEVELQEEEEDGSTPLQRSRPPQQAPWTVPGVMTQPLTTPPSGGSAGLATPPPRPDFDAGGGGALSPLISAGLILNQSTGRTIKIGGNVYNRLVAQGYSPNVATGVMTPPPATAAAGGAHSPASHALHDVPATGLAKQPATPGSAGRSARGSPTSASKQRRS